MSGLDKINHNTVSLFVLIKAQTLRHQPRVINGYDCALKVQSQRIHAELSLDPVILLLNERGNLYAYYYEPYVSF